jgi:hypothetical protein
MPNVPRPGGVIAIGVIGIIVAVFFTCGLIRGVIPEKNQEQIEVDIETAIDADMPSKIESWMMISTGILLTIGLWFYSIASFSLMRSARMGMIVLAWVMMIRGILDIIFIFVHAIPNVFMPVLHRANFFQQQIDVFNMYMYGYATVIFIFSVGFPTAVLIVYTRPRVKRAFAGISDFAMPGNFPVVPNQYPNQYQQPPGPPGGYR